MVKKKILVVDDSALMRKVVCDIINSDERFEVADVAKDGVEALACLTDHKYDAVLLDINMPRMNGIELLETLHKVHIQANIIMNSTLTKDGAQETMKALELGAIDFLTKPDNYITVKGGEYRQALLRTIEIVTKARIVKGNPLLVGMNRTVMPERPKTTATMPIRRRTQGAVTRSAEKAIVALACSTGGPKSLQSVIPKLPANLPVPVLVVQHMPAGFTKSLADRLNEVSRIKVKEAQDGEIIQPGCVYIAPGGKHLKVARMGVAHKIALTDEPPREGVKPCANYMYESLAASGYGEVICVVLTGMGSDGTKGIKYLDGYKKTYIIAQDEESSVVYGMPRSIIETGLTDEVVSLNKVTEAITKKMGM